MLANADKKKTTIRRKTNLQCDPHKTPVTCMLVPATNPGKFLAYRGLLEKRARTATECSKECARHIVYGRTVARQHRTATGRQ